LTIVDALTDPHLFGAVPCFRDLSTWAAWLVFLKSAYGLPLTEAESQVFRQHTGRSSYRSPPGGWREAVAIVGRQSGKTRIAALIAALEAVTAAREPDGTELYALAIAQDVRAAIRTLFRYAVAPFDLVPLLHGQVAARRQDAWMLTNNCTIAAYPCRPPAVRGLRARVVICDELAFYRSTENLPLDTEMLRAVRPCLATTGGRLIILSSPYAASGALYDLHRRYYGRDDAPVLVWQGSAPDMNPTLAVDYLTRMEAEDPEAYRSEVLGEFRAGVSTFLDPDALAACVATGIRERRPEAGQVYTAFADAASGSGKDAFAVCLAHGDGAGAVVDVVRAWAPPFNPSGVIAEAADLLRQYRVNTIAGDRYAPGFVAEQFRMHGITYQACEADRSTLYLELLPLINARAVTLLDDAALLHELRGLERRRGTAGRDHVDHRAGAHDDRANSVAGAVVSVRRAARRTAPEVVAACFAPCLNEYGVRPLWTVPEPDAMAEEDA
jgi:hypothetical protein